MWLFLHSKIKIKKCNQLKFVSNVTKVCLKEIKNTIKENFPSHMYLKLI